MHWITQPESWIALVTLIALEIVLGIDNIIFISIVSSRLPEAQQPKARNIGLFAAMGMRILLLLGLSWVMGLTKPLFTILAEEISGRDLILIVGGLFLLGKAAHEIHEEVEGPDDDLPTESQTSTFFKAILQIMILDIVFSLDSVITAIGMADEVQIMVIAVVASVIAMYFFMHSVSEFVQKHPTIKILSLSFLLLIGTALVADGLDFHIPKGYIYFAMAFSVFVEMLNMKHRKARV